MAVEDWTPAVARADRCGELNVVGTFDAAKSGNHPKGDTAAQAERGADGHDSIAELWPPNRDLESGKSFGNVNDGKVLAWLHLRDGSIDRPVTLPQVHGCVAGVEGLGDNVVVGDNLRSSGTCARHPSRAQPVLGHYGEDGWLHGSGGCAPVDLCVGLRLEGSNTAL